MVNIIMPLYSSMVEAHLEYCVLIWSPYLKKDIEELKKVHKMIRGLEHLSDLERLESLGLFILEA